SVGDLMARIYGDVEVWGLGVRRFVIEMWDTLLFTLSFVVAMLWYDAGLTLVVLSTTPIAMFIAYVAGRWVRARTTKARQANAAYTAALQEQLVGVRVLRLFGRTAAAVTHIAQLSRQQADANIARERLRIGLQIPYAFIISAGVILLIWQNGQRVLAGALTVGSFVAYLELYLRAINRGFREIPTVINQVQASAAAYARLQALLAPPLTMSGEARLASFRPNHIMGLMEDGRGWTEAERRMTNDGGRQTVDGTTIAAVRRLPSAVSMQHVTFYYPDTSEPALNDLSLEIPAGALVAVTGPVGSGKSALTRALLGVYPIASGRIVFGDAAAAIQLLPQPVVTIGFLPQEPFLFSGTVRENISMGEAERDGLQDTVSLAALDDDLRAMPHGLDTQVGEFGIRVSGGQRQRIAVARAIAAIRNAHVPSLLVLDDPFSAVDVNTETQIVASLRAAFGPDAPPEQRVTIVLCSHRLAAFPFADLVVVLDKGRIAEAGTHAQLMSAGGLYARIFTAQQKVEARA
ncbi:MAG: ABC transporter ATP-binding protein/permease, partial [Chloroflexi bacterium]|nr:ABC transporter ATP-binding protein/permease [Chloroflexota bacterium]